MFKRVSPADTKRLGDIVTFEFEGKPIQAYAGDTVAAALLAHGVKTFRTTAISGDSRAPWCMMGVCFECLLEIDGCPNCQSCQVQVRQGMQVARQQGARGW